MKPSFDRSGGPSRERADIVRQLRELLPGWDRVSLETAVFPFDLPQLDAHLPQGGLAAGALHEIAPETEGDMAAALGFLLAVAGRLSRQERLLFVTSRRGLSDQGGLHGHGLLGLGLDPARLVIVEAETEVTALWAVEEALRSAAPSMVVAALERDLDLKVSQRLNLAARNRHLPLLLLRPARMLGASVALTRWRVGAASASRDRFGLMARWRWRLRLERCRNGRPGEWLVEFDHVAYRFDLAAPLAHPALPRRREAQARAIG